MGASEWSKTEEREMKTREGNDKDTVMIGL